MGLKKFCFTLFGIFCFIFLIFYIIRLSNNNNEFIGFNTLYNYIQTVNIWKPFEKMHNELSSAVNSFNNSLIDFEMIHDIGSFFSVIGNFIPNLFQIIILPVHIIWYVMLFIVNFVYEIFRFFTFMTGTDLNIAFSL